MPSQIPSKAPDKSATFRGDGAGHVELRYFDAKHQYFARGGRWEAWTWLPSCSAIAKMADPPGERLTRWAVETTADAIKSGVVALPESGLDRERVVSIIDDARKAADRAKGTAGDYGTQAHALFERAVATKVWRGRVAAGLRDALEAFRAWRDEWQVEVVAQEFLILHPELGYAGTGDLWCSVIPPGESGRIGAYFDLKTSKGVYLSHMAQVAGYRQAVAACDEVPWDLGGLLHLPEGATKIEVVRQASPEKDARAFECARYLYWWSREREKFDQRRKAA